MCAHFMPCIWQRLNNWSVDWEGAIKWAWKWEGLSSGRRGGVEGHGPWARDSGARKAFYKFKVHGSDYASWLSRWPWGCTRPGFWNPRTAACGAGAAERNEIEYGLWMARICSFTDPMMPPFHLYFHLLFRQKNKQCPDWSPGSRPPWLAGVHRNLCLPPAMANVFLFLSKRRGTGLKYLKITRKVITIHI